MATKRRAKATGKPGVRSASHTLRSLLLLVIDGEPSDIDCLDPRHLVEDADKVVRELAGGGIEVVCVALDGDAGAHHRIFGRRNMPPAMYAKLTG